MINEKKYINSSKILSIIIFLCSLSCGKQQVKQSINKDRTCSKIKNIDFPKDLLFNTGHLYKLENPNGNIKIKSGYYHSVLDIFKNKISTKKTDVYKAFANSDNMIDIYFTHQFEIDNPSQCNDCNPFLNCFYFDDRFAILTQEDSYKRIVVDINTDLILLILYNEKEKGKIDNIVYLDNALNPIFFIKQEKEDLSFFEIQKRRKKKIIIPEFQSDKIKKINHLDYYDIIDINKLLFEKRFKNVSTNEGDNVTSDFFP